MAFAAILKDPDRGGYDTVATSLNDDLETIRGKLFDLMDDRRPRDSVLIYYAGHGIAATGGKLFLATEKTLVQRPGLNSLAASEIREKMRDSRASQLIVILDCCHSGAFTEGAMGTEVPVSEQTFASGEGAEGEYVLMSCNALQVSIDGAGGAMSRFTNWLIDGLHGKAAPGKPVITMDDLFDYVCRQAKEVDAVMRPERVVKRNSGALVIASNPAIPDALPKDVLAKLEDGEWRTRLAAVATLDALCRDARLRPLVRSAVAARLAVERDTDVTIALENLIAKFRAKPPDGIKPKEEVKRPEREERATVDKDVPPPPRFNKWESKVLSRAGLSGAGLSDVALKTLQDRAKALRNGNWNCWIASVGFLFLAPFSFVGYVASQATSNTSGSVGILMLVPVVAFLSAIFGLFKSEEITPGPFTDEVERKIIETAPVIRYLWTRWDARLFHRSCWIILADIIFGFVVAASKFN